MPKLLWIIACQRALISQQNTITLVDVLEDIQIQAPPAEMLGSGKPQVMLPLRFAIVGLWERTGESDPGISEGRLRLTSPSGKHFGHATFQINLALTPRFRSLVESGGLPYMGFGTYIARLEIKDGDRWKTAGATRINLIELASPPPLAS
jgi:hypothetical protein